MSVVKPFTFIGAVPLLHTSKFKEGIRHFVVFICQVMDQPYHVTAGEKVILVIFPRSAQIYGEKYLFLAIQY